jgi:DNA-binding transcriptional LysR family regulator
MDILSMKKIPIPCRHWNICAAIIDTLTINDDLKARRLVKLHSAATDMKEHVWLLYNARSKNDPALANVISGLAKNFSITL